MKNHQKIMGGAMLGAMLALGCSTTAPSSQVAHAPTSAACETNAALRPQWAPNATAGNGSEVQWHPQVRAHEEAKDVRVANWYPSVTTVSDPIEVADASCSGRVRARTY